jgi:hypothetical protein
VAVVVVFAIVPVVFAIPPVVMRQPPALTLPIPFVKAPAVVMWDHPNSAPVWGPCPVAVMPIPMVAYWIPIAFYPDKAGPGSNWPDTYDTGWGRCADFDPNRYLSEEHPAEQQREREKLLYHRRT